jgi:hypothetical protein
MNSCSIRHPQQAPRPRDQRPRPPAKLLHPVNKEGRSRSCVAGQYRAHADRGTRPVVCAISAKVGWTFSSRGKSEPANPAIQVRSFPSIFSTNGLTIRPGQPKISPAFQSGDLGSTRWFDWHLWHCSAALKLAPVGRPCSERLSFPHQVITICDEREHCNTSGGTNDYKSQTTLMIVDGGGLNWQDRMKVNCRCCTRDLVFQARSPSPNMSEVCISCINPTENIRNLETKFPVGELHRAHHFG